MTSEAGGVDAAPPAAEVIVARVVGTVSVAVTGQTVVETGTTIVVTPVERAGQSVTVAAQLMMVETMVV